MSSLSRFAREFIAKHDSVRPATPAWAQALCVVEEAGEFAGAFRRFTGHARRPGDIDDVEAELADVVIAAYVFAERQGIALDLAIHDKARTIMARSFGTDTSSGDT